MKMNKNEIKSVADLVKASAKKFGDKTFVKELAGSNVVEKSFNDFYGDISRFAGYISKKDFGGNDVHTAVIGPSSYGWLISWFGTVCGGNTAVPLDAQLSCPDICELLVRADVNVFCYDPRYEKMIPVIKENCPNVKEFIPFGEVLETILAESEPAEIGEVPSDKLAAIVYTSGTTGKSKGVMLLNSNYIDNTMCQDNESTPEDVILSVLPIHHIYCFTCDIMLSIRYGNELCFNDSMMHIPQNLKRFSPTIMLIVPMIAETMFKQIKAASAAKPEIPMAAIAQSVFGGRLKTIYSGGAYLRPELQKEFLEMGFNMAQGYGMTECSPRISTADPADKECAGDVGVIVNGCTVKIEDGEILVKSPSVMAGYYKDPEETAKTLTSDGWLRTGDLGHVDEKNRVFITGRKKNLIILSNGENVSPEELENKFAGLDFVADVLVYSEDSVITAEIFPNPEFRKTVSDEELCKLLRNATDEINKTVIPSKAIRRLRLRDNEFEKTTSKKIKRSQSEQGRKIN